MTHRFRRITVRNLFSQGQPDEPTDHPCDEARSRLLAVATCLLLGRVAAQAAPDAGWQLAALGGAMAIVTVLSMPRHPTSEWLIALLHRDATMAYRDETFVRLAAVERVTRGTPAIAGARLDLQRPLGLRAWVLDDPFRAVTTLWAVAFAAVSLAIDVTVTTPAVSASCASVPEPARVAATLLPWAVGAALVSGLPLWIVRDVSLHDHQRVRRAWYACEEVAPSPPYRAGSADGDF